MSERKDDPGTSTGARPARRIETGWLGSGLPDLETMATYNAFPLEMLPRIEAANVADWSWVPSVAKPLEWALDSGKGGIGFLRRADAAGLFVPASFRAFLGSPGLRWAIRSNTGCFWSLEPGSFAHVAALGKTVARFLSDQQGCIFWYLVLDEADPAVFASEYDLLDPDWDEEEDEGEEEDEEDGTFSASDDEDDADGGPEIFRTADSFEEFMYRFWIENEIWFRVEDGEKLTPEMDAYYAEAKRLAAAN